MRVENKIALVTGGGAGLGKAICCRLAEEGATVVVTDIDASSAERVSDEINGGGGKAIALQQDVTDESRWSEIVSHIDQNYGRLDVLVNNAGIAIVGTAEDTSFADWKRTQAANLDSVFLGTREFIRVMKAGGGSVINISSIEGLIGEPLVAAYNASKGGVRIFTKSAALHCAEKGYPIRVNSVHPGFIDTAMVENFFSDMDAEESERATNRIMGSIPLGELGKPIDIANGVLFLASEESCYMTGSELVIDGGYTAR